MDTTWLRSQVNYKQTPEERKAKYNMMRKAGIPAHKARRFRDAHMPKVELMIKTWQSLKEGGFV